MRLNWMVGIVIGVSLIYLGIFGTSGFGLALAGSRYEYYNVGDDNQYSCYSNFYRAQSFTVGATAHTITGVKLLMNRLGMPSVLTVSIRPVDGSGAPTSVNLVTGTINANTFTVDPLNTWYEIPFAEYTLVANTMYTIVCSSQGATGSDSVAWRLDATTPTYNLGWAQLSSDGGVTWMATTNDFMFEVYGNPVGGNTYIIQASAGAGGSISPSGAVSVTQGNSQTFTISPSSGYTIQSVLVDGASQGTITSYTFTNVQATHTISASFTPLGSNQFTISASAGAGGSISPSGSVVVNQGAAQSFTISPSFGYSISSVLVDGANQGSISTYTFMNVQASHTISASFSGGGGGGDIWNQIRNFINGPMKNLFLGFGILTTIVSTIMFAVPAKRIATARPSPA